MEKANRTLLVLKYLWEHTDDQHPASAADILSYLQENGLNIRDYRTVQSDVADLIAFGVDVVEKRHRQYEYNIGNRHFELPEVKLLVDAVQSSRFINQKKSKELIEKLSAFVGPHDANVIKRQLYVDEQVKASNTSVLHSVDAVHDAIAQKRKVTFQYFDYSPEKKKVARHGGQFYVVSPFSLIWSNDNYYLIGHSEDRDMVQKFRIDRIDSLSLLEERAQKTPKDYKVGDFFTREFSMMTGKACDVELLVENPLMNNIIDRFGESVHTSVVDDGHFKVTASVELSTNFYAWVFASRGKIKILGPQTAILEFNSIIDSNRHAI